MTGLWISVVRGAGQTRTTLLVATTAVVSGLALVAVSYARLGGLGGYNYDYPAGDARLLGPIADPGTRGGAIFGVGLVVLPMLLLLDQCVRLGFAAQRRRYRALAVAGATQRDLRRWGAIETGLPALLGAALGIVVWLALREVLGVELAHDGVATLVPTATGPGWWTLLVMSAVAGYGVLVGRRAAARATGDLRRDRRPPRPWGLALLVAAAVLLVVGFPTSLALFGAVLLAVVGVMATTPWLAYVLSGRLVRRTDLACELLAARRIRADYGAAGRAAAAVSAVGLTLGVLGVYIGDLGANHGDYGGVGSYLVPGVLVGVLAVAVLGVISLSLALHSIEATLARRREMATLVANGIPPATLDAAIQVECRLVTLPVTLAATVLGALVYLPLTFGLLQAAGGLVAIVVAAAAVRLAVHISHRAARPWLNQATMAANLRTE